MIKSEGRPSEKIMNGRMLGDGLEPSLHVRVYLIGRLPNLPSIILLSHPMIDWLAEWLNFNGRTVNPTAAPPTGWLTDWLTTLYPTQEGHSPEKINSHLNSFLRPTICQTTHWPTSSLRSPMPAETVKWLQWFSAKESNFSCFISLMVFLHCENSQRCSDSWKKKDVL